MRLLGKGALATEVKITQSRATFNFKMILRCQVNGLVKHENSCFFVGSVSCKQSDATLRYSERGHEILTACSENPQRGLEKNDAFL